MKIINDPSVFNTADIFLFWDWSAFCPTQLAPKIFVSSWALVCLTSQVAQVGQSNWWVVGFFTKKRFACFRIIWNVMSVFLLHWTSSCYKFKLEKIFNVFSSYSWWLRCWCCWKICKLWDVYTRILTPALPQNAWKKLEQETKSKISQILVSAFFSKRLSDSTQKGTRFAEFFSKNISTNTPFFNNYCFVSIFGRQKHLMGVRSSIQFQKNTLSMYIAVLLICWSK